MSYSPIAFTAVNYKDYKFNWLKAYESGTTTPKNMATDSTLGTLIAKAQISVDGFIISASGALITPLIDDSYDLWLFPTEAAADANDTSSALRFANNATGVAALVDTAVATGLLNVSATNISDLPVFIDNELINDLSQAYEFPILDDAVIFAGLVVGKVCHIAERTTGNGGSAVWDVVLASGVTPNTYSIVACTGVPTLALVLRKTQAMNSAMFGDDSSAPTLAASVQYMDANNVNSLQGNNIIKRGNATNMLIQSAEDNQPNRIHQEPKNNIDSGTVTKYDWMFDPYESNPVDYRIFNIVTQTGDPFGTGEGAITSINAKGVGNTWGLWPSIQFGFQDLGVDAVCSKMWYGDHMQPQHFTPNKGNWRTGKVVVIGDYLTNNNDVFIAASAGTCGSTPPTHVSGTVSDGAVDWTFTYSPAYQTVRATHMFGDRSDMPVLGHPDARVQFLKDYLIGWGADGNYLDVDGAIIASIKSAATSGGANKWLHIVTAGGGYKRFSQNENYEQNIGLALAAESTSPTDLATSINVSGITTLRVTNSVATTITNLTGGVAGQRLRIVSTNGNTTIDHEGALQSGGAIKNASQLDIVMNEFGGIDLERDSSADFWRVIGVGY